MKRGEILCAGRAAMVYGATCVYSYVLRTVQYSLHTVRYAEVQALPYRNRYRHRYSSTIALAGFLVAGESSTTTSTP